MNRKILIIALLLPLLVACGTVKGAYSISRNSGGSAMNKKLMLDKDRFGENKTARAISNNLRQRSFKEHPVIVTTFVNLNNFGKSSIFGRMMAEKLLHYMNKYGFHVVEVRRAQDLFIREEVGEMILTRNISELAKVTKAKSVLAGTYVVTSEALIINARLIDIETPSILSSYSYEVIMTPELEELLKGASPL